MSFIFVAMGGAIGAVLIGFIVGVTDSHEDISPNLILFWKTGVCGGFTTFSTFSLEAYTLLENRAYLAGGIYIALSIICCILGILWGRRLAMMLR